MIASLIGCAAVLLYSAEAAAELPTNSYTFDKCFEESKPPFLDAQFLRKYGNTLPVQVMHRWLFNSEHYHECLAKHVELDNEQLNPGVHLFVDHWAVADIKRASIVAMQPSIDEYDYANALGANGDMKNLFCVTAFRGMSKECFIAAQGGAATRKLHFNATWDESHVNRIGRFDSQNRTFSTSLHGPQPDDQARWMTGSVYGPIQALERPRGERFVHAVEDRLYYPKLSFSSDLTNWTTYRLCHPNDFTTWQSEDYNVTNANFLLGQSDCCMSIYENKNSIYLSSRTSIVTSPEQPWNWGVRSAGIFKIDVKKGCLKLHAESWWSLDDCVRQCWSKFQCPGQRKHEDSKFRADHYGSCRRNGGIGFPQCFGEALTPSWNETCVPQFVDTAYCCYSCRTQVYGSAVSQPENGIFIAALPEFGGANRLLLSTSRNGVHFRRPLPVMKSTGEPFAVDAHGSPSPLFLDHDYYRTFTPHNGTVRLLSWPRYKLFGIKSYKNSTRESKVVLKTIVANSMRIMHTPHDENKASNWRVRVYACSTIKQNSCQSWQLSSSKLITLFTISSPLRVTITFQGTVLHGFELYE